MRRYIDITDIEIPSDENNYDELVEFADAIAEQEIIQLPERKKGKWTRHFDGNEWYWYCSSCKEQWYEEDLWMGGNSFPNYCPNCGSQMNGGEQDG